jgi:hypothetical protein
VFRLPPSADVPPAAFEPPLLCAPPVAQSPPTPCEPPVLDAPPVAWSPPTPIVPPPLDDPPEFEWPLQALVAASTQNERETTRAFGTVHIISQPSARDVPEASDREIAERFNDPTSGHDDTDRFVPLTVDPAVTSSLHLENPNCSMRVPILMSLLHLDKPCELGLSNVSTDWASFATLMCFEFELLHSI